MGTSPVTITPDAISASPQVTITPDAAEPSTYDKLTASYNPNAEKLGPVGRFLDAAGGAVMAAPGALASAVAHPIDTAKGVGSSLASWADPSTRPTWEGIKSVLPEALGQGVGNVAAGEVGGAAAVKAGRAIGDIAIPSTEHAGAALSQVRSAAGDIPIDMTKPGATALELYTQSQRGATLPKVVRDFVNRATKPDSEPITYAEAKDFQSNVSSLSADERMSLKPNTKRLVGQLNADLKDSLEGAADVVGKGDQFSDAMAEYHKAMQLRGLKEDAIEALKSHMVKAVVTGAGITGGGLILKKLFSSTP
jgi:hypothetical protein